VLLDFEGLGSLERTEQEDMLLFVVNAAVSNLTIFNKRVCMPDHQILTDFDFHAVHYHRHRPVLSGGEETNPYL
jgi:hypothetical protein